MSTQPEDNVYPFPEREDPDVMEAEVVDLDQRDRDAAIDVEAVEVPDDPDLPISTEVAVRTPGRLASRLGAVADRPLVLPLAEVKARSSWWSRALGRGLLWGLTHLHVLIAAEMRPVGRGFAVAWQAWRDWVTEADMARRIDSGNATKEAAKEHLHAVSGHRKLSAFLFIVFLTGVIIVAFKWPQYLIVGGLAAVGVLDVIGRKHRDPDAPPPPVRRTMLAEGAPLGSLTTTVIERLQEEGVRVEAAGRMTVYTGGEYRLPVDHDDDILPKHLRSLERHIGALDTSIRLVRSGVGGQAELRMPTRDHLSRVPCREFVPTGSRSITEPAPLWKRSDGDPSMPTLAAVHIDLVGTTGAGKSEAVQEFISFFGECRDVYPVFGDLTMGPLGALNKRVLRRRAFDYDELEALLDWALAKVEERHKVLHELAESDDPDAPVEWDLAWGPQIQLIFDEYSFIAEHEELHEKVEAIMRVGRKVKVCVLRASQRSGVKDLGSTVAAALVGLKILMACTERDTTTMLSTQHRDQGWTPHLFRPAVKGDPRDAGKCFVWGPGHRDPEIHRFHTPNEPGETKRRDRQRYEDGLPDIDGVTPEAQVLDVLVLDETQKAVVDIFTESGQAWLPTADIVAGLAAREIAHTAKVLAEKLGKAGSKRTDAEGRERRGYALADVQAAWEKAARRGQD